MCIPVTGIRMLCYPLILDDHDLLVYRLCRLAIDVSVVNKSENSGLEVQLETVGGGCVGGGEGCPLGYTGQSVRRLRLAPATNRRLTLCATVAAAGVYDAAAALRFTLPPDTVPLPPLPPTFITVTDHA